MGPSLEARFEQCCDTIVNTLMHADREQPARWYIKGLMLPGERKSVEPMAARVQPQVGFETKPALAIRQIEAALALGYPRGVVLADAAYGDETTWREQLAEHKLTYAVSVRPGTTVCWGEHQPLTEPKPEGQRGRARRRLQRDDDHQPISVAELARVLPGKRWRTVTWRQGVSEPLSSRFARVRVRAAHRDRPRDEEWLIIEWADGADEPAHYWFSNLPRNLPFPAGTRHRQNTATVSLLRVPNSEAYLITQ